MPWRSAAHVLTHAGAYACARSVGWCNLGGEQQQLGGRRLALRHRCLVRFIPSRRKSSIQSAIRAMRVLPMPYGGRVAHISYNDN